MHPVDGPAPRLPDGQDGVLEHASNRVIILARILSDPALPGSVFFLVIALAGAVALFTTAIRVSALAYVPLQLPYLVSGGLGGMAMVVAGATLAAVNSERRDRAIWQREMGRAVRELDHVVQTVARGYEHDPEGEGR